jgi:hypothetical protein
LLFLCFWSIFLLLGILSGDKIMKKGPVIAQ